MHYQQRYSQQFRFNESTDEFKEIGEINNTGTINSYINDSEGNFVMGDMSGEVAKYLNE